MSSKIVLELELTTTIATELELLTEPLPEPLPDPLPDPLPEPLEALDRTVDEDELTLGTMLLELLAMLLLLGIWSLLELSAMLLLDILTLELESPAFWITESSSEPEHANSVKAMKAENIILLVIVQPRNIVAQHLMMLRTQASFPASTM